jgi:hypothetical protein
VLRIHQCLAFNLITSCPARQPYDWTPKTQQGLMLVTQLSLPIFQLRTDMADRIINHTHYLSHRNSPHLGRLVNMSTYRNSAAPQSSCMLHGLQCPTRA